MLSAAKDLSRGRSFVRDVYNNNNRLPNTADSRSCDINAPQEVLLKPLDRYSLSKSLRKWALSACCFCVFENGRGQSHQPIYFRYHR